MAKTDGKPARVKPAELRQMVAPTDIVKPVDVVKPADIVKPADVVKPADNVKPADVKKPRKGSQNSLCLNPRWTLHVTRPFNLYKEGQGSPKREEQETISRARHN